ncbi:MAG: glycosyltransferase, partial [Clostridia bacterium]|nr:glycosyltransferase [Clostridia bacterium]
MKFLFAGGGTAGHINPALAVANRLREMNSDAEVRFVGTKEGLEAGLIPHSGYPLEFIKVHGFERKYSLKTIKTMAEIPFAVEASKRIIKEFKPDAVVGTGGYVCGPVLYAAARLKLPTLVHESNAF